jgi:hypothetical protein
MESRKAPVVTRSKILEKEMDQILERSSAWGHCSARFHTHRFKTQRWSGLTSAIALRILSQAVNCKIAKTIFPCCCSREIRGWVRSFANGPVALLS